MGKKIETVGHVTVGPRREAGQIVGAWVRVAAGDALNRALQDKGVTWGIGRSEIKVSTVLFSIVATFDHQSANTYEWQRKDDGSLYIEMPCEHVPDGLMDLVLHKPFGSSLALEAALYKTGVLQVRS